MGIRDRQAGWAFDACDETLGWERDIIFDPKSVGYGSTIPGTPKKTWLVKGKID